MLSRFRFLLASRPLVASLPAFGEAKNLLPARKECRYLHTTPPNEIFPILVGVGVAGVLLSVKYGKEALERFQAKPKDARNTALRRFYKGGFQEKMNRREAALILGLRESATPAKVRERHRTLLMLNHPDTGGSTFLASKINEAKDRMLGKGVGDM